ncbi:MULTISPECIES: hypothetical protein [Burkholderia]|uniref:Uncharacterized protein n=1 Tax=Burkholderia pyrrocinia TaxID=60550 RepID=A0A318J040_BURPY|nr:MULTISPECIES: hypothetical protein [Burkholderia]PXX41129.1 hypothetical protein NA66_1001739 [Burkholderia pyrrocinia]SFW58541.1 hypothetical protein SAMN03159384_03054 [Burkholderia sp. NFACC33-1]SFY12083.1 hypothetical protein SAMN03159408_03266 [Burkholderia sp. NFPP32]
MSEESDLNIFRALDWIRDNAPALAKARAERVYLEEWRKSHKAMLMKEAECGGQKTTAGQERDAYASAEYVQTLHALKAAVEAEETLRWRMVAAQARIEAWRTLESTRRIEAKTI